MSVKWLNQYFNL